MMFRVVNLKCAGGKYGYTAEWAVVDSETGKVVGHYTTDEYGSGIKNIDIDNGKMVIDIAFDAICDTTSGTRKKLNRWFNNPANTWRF